MSRSLRLVTILAFATLAVAACGKRGALEPPPVSDEGSAKHNSKSEAKAGPKEHKPFILDGLLR